MGFCHPNQPEPKSFNSRSSTDTSVSVGVSQTLSHVVSEFLSWQFKLSDNGDFHEATVGLQFIMPKTGIWYIIGHAAAFFHDDDDKGGGIRVSLQ